MAAARDLTGAPRHAAYAAGQAAVVAHVAADDLGAAAYAIKAARSAASEGKRESAGRLECRWQREQLPEAIRDLVLDDQRLRNDICWSVFHCERPTGLPNPSLENRFGPIDVPSAALSRLRRAATVRAAFREHPRSHRSAALRKRGPSRVDR